MESDVPDADLGLPVSRKNRQGRMRALDKVMMVADPARMRSDDAETRMRSATMSGGAGGCHWNSWQSDDGIHSGIRCGTETCEEVCRIFLREQSFRRAFRVHEMRQQQQEQEAGGGGRRQKAEKEKAGERIPVLCASEERDSSPSLTHSLIHSQQPSSRLAHPRLSNHCDLVGHVLHHSEYDKFASVKSLHWNEFHTVSFYRWCLTATLFLMFVRIE
jgi:hypothetical protein